MLSKKIIIMFLCMGMLGFYSCAPKPAVPKAEFDTPEHHVANGNKLFESGKTDDAMREFIRAKDLDPRFSPAYVGIGISYGIKKEYEKAFEAMKTADNYANKDEESVSVDVGYMRLFLMGENKVTKNWLKEIENKFNKAVKTLSEDPSPYYFMGLAYKKSYAFQEASDQFKKVLSIGKGFVTQADKEYSLIQKVERAMPGSKVGKKVALLESISRADVAALFIGELKIDEFFEKKTLKKFDTSFKTPENESDNSENASLKTATDIENHVLKADIEAILNIGIKGLEIFPDHTYQPDNIVTRAEFAMMIEDIIVKTSGDEALSTKFIGSSSPFPDVRNDLPYFNAAMVCTTRGILEVSDKTTGKFNPGGAVSGSEALLSIRMLKSQI